MMFNKPWFLIVLFFLQFNVAQAAIGESAIQWTTEGMDNALKQAKQQQKPLFVYWGAVWCPPCNVVKSTLFVDPQFIQATHDYISVYLDGDTEEAQKWGEKLNTRGYPTLMVLSPAGQEIFRLATERPPQELAGILDDTKNVWLPMSELLQTELDAADLNPQNLRKLAFYSWGQDVEVTKNPAGYATQLFELENRITAAPQAREKSLLFMQALDLTLQSLEEDQQIAAEDSARYQKRLESIISSPELFKTNVYSLAYLAADLVEQLTTESTVTGERGYLVELILYRMREFRNQSGLTHDQYFATFYPQLNFSEQFDYPIIYEDRKQLIDYSVQALQKTTDKKAREALLSDTSYLLYKFGLKDQAFDILTSALKDSIAPYYQMSMLGYLEKKEGNNDKALEWYRKAYQSAKGPATQLQWYGSYVRNLISLKPEAVEEIKSHVDDLLSNYANMSDSFWGRNKRVLQSVARNLKEWSETQQQTQWVKHLQQQGQEKCATAKDELYQTGCNEFYNKMI